MQHNQKADPLINRAFQALLNHRRVTYLVVNRHNHLLHVCGDPLGLVSNQPEVSSCQDILKLIPASAVRPIARALQQAQIAPGHTQHTNCQIESANHEPYKANIETLLHPASSSTEEFLTLLIEREDCNSASTDLSVRTPVQHHLSSPTTPETTELIEVNIRLRAEVLERQQTEQKLAHKAEALARSNADLEEFAYVVSHDLQEPLRAMTAFSQLLDQRYKEQLDGSAKRYINHIVDGGTRMKAMIDGILELSRINNTQLNNNPTALEQALATALENLKLIRFETQTTITHNALPILYVDKKSHCPAATELN